MINWLNTLNTTSFRIVASVGLTYMTGIRYMASGIVLGGIETKIWNPDWKWLLFIWGLAGVEGAVLIAKRLSDYKYQEIKANTIQPQVVAAQVDTVKVEAPVKVESNNEAQG